MNVVTSFSKHSEYTFEHSYILLVLCDIWNFRLYRKTPHNPFPTYLSAQRENPENAGPYLVMQLTTRDNNTSKQNSPRNGPGKRAS